MKSDKKKKRGKYGEGSVTQVGDRFRVRVPYHGRMVNVGTCDTAEEADQLRVATVSAMPTSESTLCQSSGVGGDTASLATNASSSRAC